MGTTSSDVLLKVLQAIAPRPVAHGFERPEVPGLAREQIDAAVEELRRGGYVEAAWVGEALGDNPAQWEPSVLTLKGRHLLEELLAR